jgi:broad specificity phosphatase PhoE
MTRISLVRHGLVENPDRVYYGRLDGFGLAAKGRAQAAAAGRYLAGDSVAAIYHSPMLRARQTALILQAHIHCSAPLIASDLLNEIYSPYDGRSAAEMERLNWDFYHNLTPPYEGPDEVLARILTFFEHACREHPVGHVVGVTHGDPIAFAILWAFSLPIASEGRHRLTTCGVPQSYPAPASISTFTFDYNGRPETVDFCYSCPSCGM